MGIQKLYSLSRRTDHTMVKGIKTNNDLQEMIEDTQGMIRNCKSTNTRQYNGQNKLDKGTNNGLQNIIEKTED